MIRKTTDDMTTHEMRAMLRSHTWINKTNIAHARRFQLVRWMDSQHVLEIAAGRKAQRRITPEYLAAMEAEAYTEDEQYTREQRGMAVAVDGMARAMAKRAMEWRRQQERAEDGDEA